jgi:hypothetical protein
VLFAHAGASSDLSFYNTTPLRCHACSPYHSLALRISAVPIVVTDADSASSKCTEFCIHSSSFSCWLTTQQVQRKTSRATIGSRKPEAEGWEAPTENRCHRVDLRCAICCRVRRRSTRPNASSPTTHHRKNCSGAFPMFASDLISGSEILRKGSGCSYSTSQLPASLSVYVLSWPMPWVWYRQLRGTIYVTSRQERAISACTKRSPKKLAGLQPPFGYLAYCVASAQAAAEMMAARFRSQVQTSKRGNRRELLRLEGRHSVKGTGLLGR